MRQNKVIEKRLRWYKRKLTQRVIQNAKLQIYLATLLIFYRHKSVYDYDIYQAHPYPNLERVELRRDLSPYSNLPLKLKRISEPETKAEHPLIWVSLDQPTKSMTESFRP